MKKTICTTLLTAGALAFAAMTAHAEEYDTYEVKLTVNDASLISVNCETEEDYFIADLENGENTFSDFDDWSEFEVRANSGAIIKKITWQQASGRGDSVTQKDVTKEWVTYALCELGQESDVQNFNLYTINIEVMSVKDALSASFTLNVDDADKVSYSFSPVSMPSTDAVTLVNGANTIQYIPEAMTSLTIKPKNSYNDPPLYQVKLNGEVQTSTSTSYTLPVSEGMVVDVITVYPDEDVKITFDLQNAAKEAITSVTVDGEEVTGWESGELNVKLGSQLSVNVNDIDYDITTGTWDGTKAYFPISKWITGPATLVVDAAKKPTYSVNVNITDGAGVVFEVGKAGYTKEIKLNDGDNPDVQVPVNNGQGRITITPASGYLVDEVVFNDSPVVASSYTGNYVITLTEGSNNFITIKTTKIVRDQEVVFYVNDRDVWRTLSVRQGYTANDMTLEQGYNVYERGLNELENLNISAMPMDWSMKKFIYKNGEEVEYILSADLGNLKNGDIVKIYAGAEAPATYKVDFTVASDVEGITIKRDIIKDVTPADGLSCLVGTQVSISSPVDIVVKVNGTEVTAEEEEEVSLLADSEYVYTFNVDENQTVSIEKKINTGIDNVTGEDGNVEIYNLQGIHVNSDNLPAGLYIINGKKVMVK